MSTARPQRPVHVVGVGMIPFTKPGASAPYTQMGAQAASLAGLERSVDARSAMTRLLRIEPGFTLAAERRLRRFGESPEMERYLADLAHRILRTRWCF